MRLPPLRHAIVLAATVAAAAVGCGPHAQEMTCPNDLPASCPDPAPTFSGDGGVAALFATYCERCHSTDGGASNWPLQSYAQISTTPSIISQIYQCRMPLAGEPQPTPAERQTLLGWLVCGSPND